MKKLISRVGCAASLSALLFCTGCGDDDPDPTKYDGSYAVTLKRTTGQEARTCIDITNGNFAIAGLNSEGFPFDASGAVNDSGQFTVTATLGDENTTVGVVATVDDAGVIAGNYSIATEGAVVGEGTVEGASVDACPAPPDLPAQVNLSDHYGVRMTVPLAAGGSLVVTTYNAGLAPTFVPFAAERALPNVDAIAAHEADVMCLQEVWADSHMQAVADAATDYPHTYSVPAEQVFTDGAPCTAEEVAPIRQCVVDSCGTLTGDDFTQCIIDKCSGILFELNDVNPTCGGALIALVGTDDIEAAFEAVTKPSGLFAFNGSTGLMILSKHPLSDTQVLDFIDRSTSNHRAALFATVNVGGVDHKIGCTHLTANLVSVPYTGPLASWEEEGNVQAADMISFATTYAGTDATYLAGDFNCSLPNATTDVEGDFEANCQRFLDDGYVSAGMDQLGCSFCKDNILNTAKAGGGGEGSLLLDHVFTKNVAAGAQTAEIVFDQLIDL